MNNVATKNSRITPKKRYGWVSGLVLLGLLTGCFWPLNTCGPWKKKDGPDSDLTEEQRRVRNANLTRLRITNTCAGCQFFNADLRNWNLKGARLHKADMLDANLSGANLAGADLSETELGGATLVGIYAPEVNLSGAWLSDTNFRSANLQRANLCGIRGASSADFSEADLRRANLQDADLCGTGGIRNRREPAHMLEPEVGGAALERADLRGANLKDAMLCNVALDGARLDGADLSEASLRGATLNGATLDNATLADTRLSGTTWIDGRMCHRYSRGHCRFEPVKRDKQGRLPKDVKLESWEVIQRGRQQPRKHKRDR